jgi:hypothetical protein
VIPNQVPVGSWASHGMVHRLWNEMLDVKKWQTIFLKLKKNFWSKGNYFSLTIILCHAKHPKMRKTFSVNYFTAKQTKPKFRENG